MKIRKETIYIAECDGAEKTLRLGEHVTLVFYDGTCLSGDIMEVFEVGIMIKVGDRGRSFGHWEIQEIRQ